MSAAVNLVPRDILISILRIFPFRTRIFVFSLVCRQWRTAVLLSVSELPSNARVWQNPLVLRLFLRLRSFNIPFGPELDTPFLLELAPRIHSVNAHTHLSPKQWAILRECKSVSFIEMNYRNRYDPAVCDEVIVNNAALLVSLALHHHNCQVPTAGASIQSLRVPRLEALHLTWRESGELSPHLLRFLQNNFASLTTVSVDEVNLDLLHAILVPKLRLLCIGSCILSVANVTWMVSHSCLTELRLYAIKGEWGEAHRQLIGALGHLITEAGLPEKSQYVGLPDWLSRLHSLSFPSTGIRVQHMWYYCRAVCDGMMEFGKTLRLRSLELPAGVNDCPARHVVKVYCTTLTRLILIGLTDYTWLTGWNLPLLRELHWSANIDPLVVVNVFDYFPSLRFAALGQINSPTNGRIACFSKFAEQFEKSLKRAEANGLETLVVQQQPWLQELWPEITQGLCTLDAYLSKTATPQRNLWSGKAYLQMTLDDGLALNSAVAEDCAKKLQSTFVTKEGSMTLGSIFVAILALMFALVLPSILEDGSFIVMRNTHRLVMLVYHLTGADTRNASVELRAAEMLFRGMLSVLRFDNDAHFLKDLRRLTSLNFPMQAQPRMVPGVSVSEIVLDGGAGPRALLIIDDKVKENKLLGGRTSPTLLYFHGGGFSTLSAAFFRAYLSLLSRFTSIRVVAVEYRLVPEHSLNDAVDDCMAWYNQMVKDGVRPATIFLGGDSAGGFLAYAVAAKLRDTKQPSPAAMLLLYESFFGSTVKTATDPVLPTKAIERYASIMKPFTQGSVTNDRAVEPLKASLKGMPPVYISGAGQDPLFDDARRFVSKAREEKHEVEQSFQETAFHDWYASALVAVFGIPESVAELQRIGTYIKAHLHAFFMSTR